jgi:heat shock protein HslJ
MSIRGSATQHAQEAHDAWRFAAARLSRRRALSIGAAALFALAALAGSGCSSGGGSSVSPSSAGADNSKALEGKTWKATEIVGVTAVLIDKGTEVTAAFAAGELSGSGGVNRYTATYETQPGDEIKISQPASTMMAGPPEAMAQEQAYFAALTKATRYSVTPDSLTLTDDGGAVLVRYAVVQPTTLVGTEWDALAYNNGKGGLQSLAASSAITATFGSDGSLAGNASVNRYSTTYTTSGDTMSVDAQIVSTKMAGPEELMKQESAYLAALPQTATYTIEGDELWLRDSSGAALAHYVAK